MCLSCLFIPLITFIVLHSLILNHIKYNFFKVLTKEQNFIRSMLFNCCRNTFSQRTISARGSYCYMCWTQERKGKIVPQVLGSHDVGQWDSSLDRWRIHICWELINRAQSRSGTADISSHTFWQQRSLSPNSCVCKQPCDHPSLTLCAQVERGEEEESMLGTLKMWSSQLKPNFHASPRRWLVSRRAAGRFWFPAAQGAWHR